MKQTVIMPSRLDKLAMIETALGTVTQAVDRLGVNDKNMAELRRHLSGAQRRLAAVVEREAARGKAR